MNLTCKNCGIGFVARSLFQGGHARKFCSRKCKLDYSNAAIKARRLETRETRFCLHCSSQLHRAAQAKFCSRECLSKQRHLVERDERIAGLPARSCRRCQAPIGAERNARSVYCSERCGIRANAVRAASARRARIAGAPVVESIDRYGIIARDKSTCHLCGKRVPKAQIHLDHLVPLSRGGEHTARNLAVAHADCNRRRRDGVYPAQLRLIG